MRSMHALLICVGLAMFFCANAQSLHRETVYPEKGTKQSLFFPLRYFTTLKNLGTTDYYPTISVCPDLSFGSTSFTWYFDTFELRHILAGYSIIPRLDSTKIYPIPPNDSRLIDFRTTIADEIPQVLIEMENSGYGELIPRAYFSTDSTITNEQLDSIDNALHALFLDKLKGISTNGIYYPIDKADSASMRILLRTLRDGNFRPQSDSMFVFQQLYDFGNVPIDAEAAMQLDQCCYGTDIWAWKQMDILLADAFQDIVVNKNLDSIDAYRSKMEAIADTNNSDRVQVEYRECRSQLEIFYRIIRDFGEW